MKVKELVKLLQNCNQEAEVIIDNTYHIGLVWSGLDHVSISTEPTQEMLDDMEREEYFLRLAEEVEQGKGEMLDALKINGVQ